MITTWNPRIRQGASASLSILWTDNDEAAADAAGTMTVGVTAADGTVVIAAGTATIHGSTGVYTKAVTAAQTASLGQLVATWTDSAASTAPRTTTFDIVGARYFSEEELRMMFDMLDPSTYSPARIRQARDIAENEVEAICDRAFVPRYARLVASGNDETTIVLDVNDLRALVSMRTYPTKGATTYTSMTAQQIADTGLGADGTLTRVDGVPFEGGTQNLVFEVHYGLDAPPPDLKNAVMRRTVDLMQVPRLSSMSDRARTWNPGDGSSYELDVASRYKTGLHDVDAVYERYSLRVAGTNADGTPRMRPASRALQLDPQRYSMFHGPRR